jgi:hypothetical protein
MFATVNKDRAGKLGSKPERAPEAPSRQISREPNRIWQSLALSPTKIQPKLSVSQPGDSHEREADQIADRVMRIGSPVLGDSKLSFTPTASARVQRKCDGCKQEEPEGELQRAHDGASDGAASQRVHESVNTNGRPLEPGVRAFFERRLGYDFSDVRVHTGMDADASARRVSALAYTVGRDVVFSSGHYAPHSTTGQRLLAHELAHVVQQSRSPAAALGKGISNPRDPAEREADRAADVATSNGNERLPEIQLSDNCLQRDVGWASRGPDPWGSADSPWCEGAPLAPRRQEGYRYGYTLCEAQNNAATLEGGHPDDFNLVPEYRRPFLRRVGERSWAVTPPPVTISDEMELRCFIEGVNEGINDYQASEAFWGKVAESLQLLSIYLSARSLGQFAVAGSGPRPRLRLIRSGGGGGGPSGGGSPPAAPRPAQITSPPSGPPRPAAVAVTGRGPAAAAAAVPAQAPEIAPVTPPRPRPVLVHSQAQPQAAAPAAPAPGLPPAVGVAAATQPQPQPQQRTQQCTPVPVCPHLGGDPRHNNCADVAPPNRFPGCDVLVNGKRFDALQVGPDVLWEVKTDNYSTFSPFLQRQVIINQVPELQRERAIAVACQFSFMIGVTDAAHRAALLAADPTLPIVVIVC